MSDQELPYKIACLCDLRDADGRVLLLERAKAPNKGLCSPIGGKLEMGLGESPARCAQREIFEEAGLDIPMERLHLAGMISECAFEGKGHWLMMYYRVLGPVEVPEHGMDEGELKWFDLDVIPALALPESDRKVIWPMVLKNETEADGHGRTPFFAVHIDCRGGEMTWSVEQDDAKQQVPVGGLAPMLAPACTLRDDPRFAD